MDMLELRGRIDLARQRRRPFEAAVQEVSDLCTPYRGDITTQRSPGDNRIKPSQGVFDSTGVLMADQFTAYMGGMVFPSTQVWFGIGLPERFDKNVRARQLADQATRRMFRSFAASNFYSERDGWMRDTGVLGRGGMMSEALPPLPANEIGSTWGGARYAAIPWGRLWFLTGAGGEPIFMVREVDMPAITAKRQFGKAGAAGEKAITDGRPMEVLTYLFVAWLNENAISGGLRHPLDRRWVSHWMLEDSESKGLDVLETRGQDLPPIKIARWIVVDGEEEGRGQGWIARPDMKGVNKLREMVLDAAGQDLRPPFIVEEHTDVDLDIRAGGTIIVSAFQQQKPGFLQSGARYDVANAIGVEDRNAIQRAFLADLIGEPETQDRSAEATRFRARQVGTRLAPRGDRLYNEMHAPIVLDHMHMMLRHNALPEIEELFDMGVEEFEILATSPFFLAQKEGPLATLEQWIDSWTERAARLEKPELLDPVNFDAAVRLSHQLGGIPAEALKTEREVAQDRAVRQQQLDQQRQIDQAEQLAKVAQAAPQVAGGVPV